MTATTTTALPAGVRAGAWTIDASHSRAGFTVRHAGISKVHGTVAITSGEVVVGDTVEASSIVATLDATSVDTGAQQRDEHLRSADFFEVEAHPTWEFRSTAVRADGDEFLVEGDLTIRGTTRPVTLRTEFEGAATDPFGAARLGATATTEISRKDFGLTWNAALETGGVLVSDKVTITLDVSAVAQG